LQWATVLVAVLLVVVVAGDLFLSGRLASPGGQPEIAMLRQEKADTAVTVVVESKAAEEAPAVKDAAGEDAEVKTPGESPQLFAAPTSTDTADSVTDQGTAQPQAMRVEKPISGTMNQPPMAIEEKSGVAPQAPSKGNVITEDTSLGQPVVPPLTQPAPEASTPQALGQGQQREEGTPLALAQEAPDQADEPLPEPERAESPGQDTPSTLPTLLSRAGWRVAEVGLGILLVGLIVAILWRRRKS
jgi:hypothetical protein